jgi:hypothetical protein
MFAEARKTLNKRAGAAMRQARTMPALASQGDELSGASRTLSSMRLSCTLAVEKSSSWTSPARHALHTQALLHPIWCALLRSRAGLTR